MANEVRHLTDMHSFTIFLLYGTGVTLLAAAQDGTFSVMAVDGLSSIEAQGAFSIDVIFWDSNVPSSSTSTTTDTETLQVTSIVTSSLTSTISLGQVPSASPITTVIDSTSDVPCPTASASFNSTSFLVDVGAFINPTTNETEFEFRPNSITAHVGDSVLFNMLGESHSVTQSSFNNPCQKQGPFDTDLQANLVNISDLTIKQFFVYTNDPLWFYCKQKTHCQKGMVFAINPGSSAQMEAFVNKARMSGSDNPANATSPQGNSTTTPCSSVVITAPSNVSQTVLPLLVNSTTSWLGWNASSSRSGNVPSPPPATAFPTSSNNTQAFGPAVTATGVSGNSQQLAPRMVGIIGILSFLFGNI